VYKKLIAIPNSIVLNAGSSEMFIFGHLPYRFQFNEERCNSAKGTYGFIS